MANRTYKRSSRAARRRKQKMLAYTILGVMILLIILIIAGIVSLIKGHSQKDKPATKPTVTQTAGNSQAASSAANQTTEQTSAKDNETTAAEKNTESNTVANSSEWYLKLVNKTHKLSATPDIELETVANGHQVDKRIAPYLNQMLSDARAAGLNPIICSSFRTHERQTYLYNLEVDSFKNKGYSDSDAAVLAAASTAVPGTSEHQLGLAVDIVSASYQLLNDDQENTAEQKWLMANCYKYGFILRYPKDKVDITGYMYEPWHYRYVGKEAAKEIMEKGICLEEYLGEY